MRTAILALMVGALTTAAGQSEKPSPAIPSKPPAAARPPAVFWRHTMPAIPRRTLQAPVRQGLPTAPALAAPDVPVAARETVTTLPPQIPAPSKPSAPSHEVTQNMLSALAAIQPGTQRSDVVAKLGQPAYSIATPDGDHIVERCRFRAGADNLALIEFRDGVVEKVDRAVR